jgi:hypothetical protein
MTVLAALANSDDVVVAADGFATDEGWVSANRWAIKSCRLNNRLLLACSGTSDHAKDMLAALDERCSALDSADPFGEFERVIGKIGLGYDEARGILIPRYSYLVAEVQKLHNDGVRDGRICSDTVSSFILAGRSHRGIAVSLFKPIEDEDLPGKSLVVASPEEVAFSVSDKQEAFFCVGMDRESSSYKEMREIATDTANGPARVRLAMAMCHVATIAGTKYGINQNVLTRCLRGKFARCWNPNVQAVTGQVECHADCEEQGSEPVASSTPAPGSP